MLLRLKNIVIHYQKVAAIQGISLEFQEGRLVTIIGSNGAGKSTTLRTISGLVRPSAGEILFDGQRIDGLAPDKVLKLGIAHVRKAGEFFRTFRSWRISISAPLSVPIRKKFKEIWGKFSIIFRSSRHAANRWQKP